MEKIYFIVEHELDGARIDSFLASKLTDFTRSRLQKILTNGLVVVNGKVITKSYKVKAGDSIEIELPEAVPIEAEKENIPLDIIYQDEDLIVVNKPKGMVVHPAPGNYTGTMVNALLYHCEGKLSSINGVIRPGIVHRIDKDTSGLLIVAKNDKAHENLAKQIKDHSFTRKYEAVVYGRLKVDGTVDKSLARSKKDRKKMAISNDETARNAVSHYKVKEIYKEFSYIEVALETGRTHQIRVHMASLGHPVAGDVVYGPKKVITKLKGQCLHARTIGFIHPTTGEYMEFTSELPEYFTDFLKTLGEQC